MKAISLFSGVGGFDIGFERAGIETVLQAEQDPWCLEVLARHWPQTERVTDVRDVSKERASAVIGRMGVVGAGRSGEHSERLRRGGREEHDAGIDLIYGGFPCQDVSVAGKRAGLGGERSGLWFEFERILSELRPRWAVIENVPGLLSSNQGRDFAVILDGLGELGFDVAWAVLDAQHFGVPQRRRRVFVVAGPSRRSVEQVLSLCESCGGNPETGRATGQDVTGTLGGGSSDSSRGYQNDLDGNGAFIASLTGGGEDSPESGRVYDARGLAPTLDSRQTNVIPIQDAREVEKQQNGLGIGNPGDPMFTLDGAQGQAVIHPALRARDSKGIGFDYEDGRLIAPVSGVRRLTPLECERLMGWPDDWTRWTAGGKEIADSHRYRMAGNGVVASVAEWLGHRIVAVDEDLGQVSIPIKTPWYLTDEALAAAIAQEVAWAKEKRE